MGGSMLNKNSTKNEVHTIKSFATKVVKKHEPTIIDEIVLDENRQEIQKAIMKMFETEALGLKEEATKDSKFTADDIYAMEQFKRHIEWKNGRYYVKPLLKKNFIPMKNNYHIALRRYRMLRKQLEKHPAQGQMYSEAIQKMIDNKEVEPIYENQFQMADPNRQINYIPHFGVFRLDKATTKCRPVFDNSSTNEDGISLNQQLLKGPKTQNSIKGMLMHTRLNPIVLNGDIQRFFYAIHYLEKVEHEGNVIENIRDLYRFLWSSEPNVPPKAYRFVGALMGGTDTPYVASAVVIHHIKKLWKNQKIRKK